MEPGICMDQCKDNCVRKYLERISLMETKIPLRSVF